jgi:hypothetical protein
MWLIVFQRLIIEFFLDILYFPVWWYTGGIGHHFYVCRGLFRDGNRALAPGLWLRNIFVPMFGQQDWQGRIVGFFMRFINVVGRSIMLLVWFVVVVGVFFLWIFFPVFVGYLFYLSVV